MDFNHRVGSLIVWRADHQMNDELYIVLQRRCSMQSFRLSEVPARTLCVHRGKIQFRNVYDFDVENSCRYTLLDDELPENERKE